MSRTVQKRFPCRPEILTRSETATSAQVSPQTTEMKSRGLALNLLSQVVHRTTVLVACVEPLEDVVVSIARDLVQLP